MFIHKVLRVNYTSYDMRRGQDSMNPRTHADIMTLAPETTDFDAHPFQYSRIIAILHCDVQHNVGGIPTPAIPIDILWVRRFRLDASFKGGFKRKRLHRIEFLPDDDPRAYGFVHPDEVIRGAHLIPAFAHNTVEFRHTSLARKPGEMDDWRYHYVNLCVLLFQVRSTCFLTVFSAS
jgi:hypothetical protein